MKKIALLIAMYLLAETITAQSGNGGNVGIGTTSPQEKLHIAGGNLRIEDGIIARNATGIYKDLLPVAIATIGASGVVTGGTSNVSCTKNGNDFIVNIGQDNANCQLFISLLPGVAVSYAFFKLSGADNNKFRVELYNSNGVKVSSGFNLLVFKAGNDPLHEYNITISANTNALRIGHGSLGIEAYGVDSVTINVTILAGVIIGGPDPDTVNDDQTGSINIVDIPCPAKITITNFGQIIGRGGRGGRGGGTYQTASPNTSSCNINPGNGQPGGHAIYTEKKITVNNQGFMAGGGGGGGAGKSNSTAGSNGGGGGTGAGWPLVAGGAGGSSFYAANAFGTCPPGGQFTGCPSQACCCGGYAPFGTNGVGNTHPNGNVFGGGSGGAGINGGSGGLFGGGLALAGVSSANTSTGGTAGKCIQAASANATGNVVTNTNGGSFAGVVD